MFSSVSQVTTPSFHCPLQPTPTEGTYCTIINNTLTILDAGFNIVRGIQCPVIALAEENCDELASTTVVLCASWRYASASLVGVTENVVLGSAWRTVAIPSPVKALHAVPASGVFVTLGEDTVRVYTLSVCSEVLRVPLPALICRVPFVLGTATQGNDVLLGFVAESDSPRPKQTFHASLNLRNRAHEPLQFTHVESSHLRGLVDLSRCPTRPLCGFIAEEGETVGFLSNWMGNCTSVKRLGFKAVALQIFSESDNPRLLLVGSTGFLLLLDSELRPIVSIPSDVKPTRHSLGCLSKLSNSFFIVRHKCTSKIGHQVSLRSSEFGKATVVHMVGHADQDERLSSYCEQLVAVVEQQAETLEAKTLVVQTLEQQLLESASSEIGLREKIVETKQAEIRLDHHSMANDRAQAEFTMEAEKVVKQLQEIRR